MEQKPTDAEVPADSKTEGAAPAPQAFDAEYVQRLRRENKARREELNALKAEVEALKKAAPAADAAGLQQRLEQADAERVKLAAELAAERRTALAAKIAREYDLPDALAGRLKGEDEDELREDAEALKAALPASGSASRKATGTTPAPAGSTVNDERALFNEYFGGGRNSVPASNGGETADGRFVFGGRP